MKANRINLDSLEVKVREIAEQYPDSRYKRTGDVCLYKQGDNGTSCSGCIMGLAIKDLDPDVYEDIDETINGPITRILRVIYEISSGTKWFEIVQKEQDNGRLWKECISMADELERKDE